MNRSSRLKDILNRREDLWIDSETDTSSNSDNENIDKVIIYDISGKQLFFKHKVSDKAILLQNLNFAEQVLLIKIILDNGYQKTKKVIIK